MASTAGEISCTSNEVNLSMYMMYSTMYYCREKCGHLIG
jgi:hypothetical protein